MDGAFIAKPPNFQLKALNFVLPNCFLISLSGIETVSDLLEAHAVATSHRNKLAGRGMVNMQIGAKPC